MFKKIIAAILSVVLVIALGVVFCSTRVPTGHTGIVTTFGKVEDATLSEGLQFKAPWNKIVKMDNRIQKSTMTLSCFSSDTQEVTIVYTVNHQIDQKNASKIYKTIGLSYFDSVIAPAISESVKVVSAKYTAENLVAQREDFAKSVEADLAKRLEAYNIKVVDTSIEDMDFTDAYTNAVEAKQVALQNKLKAETEAEQKIIEAEGNAKVARAKAQGEADAKLIAAEAEAAANRKIAESLTDEVLANKYFEKWNGKLPTVAGSDAGIILPDTILE